MADEPINPAVKLARERESEFQRQADLLRSYKMVFGDSAATRTTDQEKVWEDLEKVGFFKFSTAKANAAGIVDPHQTCLNEGKRMFFLYLLANVTHVLPKSEQQPQPK